MIPAVLPSFIEMKKHIQKSSLVLFSLEVLTEMLSLYELGIN